MGVNLRPLIEIDTIAMKELKNKVITVDASNVLHQFLSTIRGPDGSPLKDPNGIVISHLVGLFYRTIRVLNEFLIKPIYVFDGEMPDLKTDVIRKRARRREKAREKWIQAREAGDEKKAYREAVRSAYLDNQMLDDAKRLLDLLGLPTVQAPSEAEAQCAYMTKNEVVFAMNSRDYDSLLFGAEKLLRHLTISNKENVEIIILENFLQRNCITIEQLVDIGILMGTDYNNGIYGVGPKTALKLIKEHNKIENIPDKYVNKLEVDYQDIRKLFLDPPITTNYELKFKEPDREGIIRFLCDEKGFPRDRVTNNLEKQVNCEGVKLFQSS